MPLVEILTLSLSAFIWLFLGRAWCASRTSALCLLFLALLVEVLAMFVVTENNTWLFNLYLPLDFACTFWLVISTTRHRSIWIPLALLFLSMGGSVFEVWIRNDSDALITTTFSLGCLFMVLLIVKRLLQVSSDADNSLLRNGAFWLLLGQLIYFGGMIPYNALVDHLYSTDKGLARSLSEINLVLASLRYLSMGVALLLVIQTGKSSSSSTPA